jgi:hypothetical protein
MSSDSSKGGGNCATPREEDREMGKGHRTGLRRCGRAFFRGAHRFFRDDAAYAAVHWQWAARFLLVHAVADRHRVGLGTGSLLHGIEYVSTVNLVFIPAGAMNHTSSVAVLRMLALLSARRFHHTSIGCGTFLELHATGERDLLSVDNVHLDPQE